MKWILLSALLLPPIAAAAKKTTITVAAGEGELHLTFDPDKVSADDVKAAAALAPESSPDGDNIPTIENCAGGSDPGSKTFLDNGARCIEKGRAELARVSALPAPVEMLPSLTYLKDQAGFYLALEEAKLAFLRSGALAELQKPIGGIDPRAVCKDPLAKVGDGGDLKLRFKVVSFAFHNCMNDAWSKKSRNYPKAPWKNFLRSRDVRARLVLPAGD